MGLPPGAQAPGSGPASWPWPGSITPGGVPCSPLQKTTPSTQGPRDTPVTPPMYPLAYTVATLVPLPYRQCPQCVSVYARGYRGGVPGVSRGPWALVRVDSDTFGTVGEAQGWDTAGPLAQDQQAGPGQGLPLLTRPGLSPRKVVGRAPLRAPWDPFCRWAPGSGPASWPWPGSPPTERVPGALRWPLQVGRAGQERGPGTARYPQGGPWLRTSKLALARVSPWGHRPIPRSSNLSLALDLLKVYGPQGAIDPPVGDTWDSIGYASHAARGGPWLRTSKLALATVSPPLAGWLCTLRAVASSRGLREGAPGSGPASWPWPGSPLPDTPGTRLRVAKY